MGNFEPHLFRNEKRIDLANEFTVLLLFSFLVCQTDLVRDLSARGLTGWCFIAVTSLNILANLVYILTLDFITIKRKIRLCILKRKQRALIQNWLQS